MDLKMLVEDGIQKSIKQSERKDEVRNKKVQQAKNEFEGFAQ